jgi:hypothetical protein
MAMIRSYNIRTDGPIREHLVTLRDKNIVVHSRAESEFIDSVRIIGLGPYRIPNKSQRPIHAWWEVQLFSSTLLVEVEGSILK